MVTLRRSLSVTREQAGVGPAGYEDGVIVVTFSKPFRGRILEVARLCCRWLVTMFHVWSSCDG